MSVRRTVAMSAAAGVAAAVGVGPALPALAHGAPVRPVSRTAACAADNAADGADAGSAACRAARAANGGPFGSFDNLRVPGVNGRDRQVIPDGELCSGGLSAFKGLNVARADWPASTLTAGGTLDVRYRTTIPHRGTFRIYLTRADYRPGERLRWQDLPSEPILKATDPPVRDGAYRMSGRLPADRTGRHVLYTIWQTTDTPDTYYSCSDVVLTARAGAAVRSAGPSASAARSAAPKARATPSAATPSAATPSGAVPEAAGPTSGAGGEAGAGSWFGPPDSVAAEQVSLGPKIVSAALVVLVAVTAGMAVVRIRASRATQGIHRRAEKR